MEKKIKKYFVEDNKYIWECDNIRIVFSDPQITGYNSFTPITKDKNGILYYYYTVEIYKYVYVEPEVEPDWNEDLEKYYDWVLFHTTYTHDFPQVESLSAIIEELMNDDMSEAQIIHLRNDGILKRKMINTDDFMYEDYYEITKEVSSTTQTPYQPFYSLYVGFGVESDADLNTLGAKVQIIYEEEMIELKNCVDAFIKYSIDSHNEDVKKRNKLFHDAMVVLDGKITCYEMNVIDFVFDKNKVSKTLIAGDLIEIYLTESDEECDCDIRGEIKKITEESISLKDGNVVKLKDIAYISKCH